MYQLNSLKGTLLISSPQEHDLLKTLVFISDHNEDGAMGLVVNKPLSLQTPVASEEADSWHDAHATINLPSFPEPETGFSNTHQKTLLPSEDALAYSNTGVWAHHTPVPSFNLYTGGPLESDVGFVLHTHKKDPGKAKNIFSVTPAIDFLESRMLSSETLLAMGYTAWSSGMLEEELHKGSWWVASATQKLLFDTAPEKRWETALTHMGLSNPFLPVQEGSA